MNILLVSYAFHPEISPRSFRTTELAKELARQGNAVTVVTRGHPAQAALAKAHGLRMVDLGELRWPAVKVRGRGGVRWFWRALSRLLSLLLEYPNIQLVGKVRRALQSEEGYDLLISVAVPYPIHWGVAAVRGARHPIARVWVADCGDPYMGQENDSFRPPFYFGWVERWFCRKADYLSVPTSGAIQGYYPEFHPKIRVIPQGFRFEELVLPEKVENPVPTFVYAGMFIPGRRDPTDFLTFLCGLNEEFRFEIYTNTPALVEPWVGRSRGRIVLKAVLPRLDLLKRLARMDFLINFENVGTTQTPSKLIDYAIIGRPILAVRTGALDPIQIRAFLAGDYRGQYPIADPDQYRIERVARQFLELVPDR